MRTLTAERRPAEPLTPEGVWGNRMGGAERIAAERRER